MVLMKSYIGRHRGREGKSECTWGATGVEGQRGGKFREGKLYCVCYACRVSVGACTCTCGCKCKRDICVDTCTCVCSSAHSCGRLANGGDAMAILHIHVHEYIFG